jgi:heterodisulfide reductase subunit B2
MENKTMKVSYYPGCSLEVTAKSYDLSFQQVCRSLGVELEEVPGWLCCGSSAGLKMSRLLSLSLAAKNLSLAEKQKREEVVVPCPFCFRRLLSARQEINRDEKTMAAVRGTIEAPLEGNLTIRNLLGFFHESVGLAAIKGKIWKPLNGLKVLPYYGCYMVKPAQVTQFDDPENPTSMDRILTALGAEVLDWDFKTECCGASLTLSKTEKVLELSGRILREANWKGADALVVACQLCQSNLDMRQEEIIKTEKKKRLLPILYISQLMGVAFGLSARDLGLNSHLVDPLPLLRERGLL